MVSGLRFGCRQYQDGDLQGNKGDDGALVMFRPPPRQIGHAIRVTYQFEKVKGILSDPESAPKQMQCPERGYDDEAGSGQDSQDSFFKGN